MATYDELMSAARKADAAGDGPAAKRFLELAKQAKAPVQKNADGTYGQPPEGFFPDPRTGAMTSRELLANNAPKSGYDAFVAGGLQGTSFGAGDEIMGALGYLQGGKDMANLRQEQARANLEANQQAYPWTTGLSELGGAMAAPGAAIGRAGSLGMRMLESAGLTGALSALYGFNSAEGDASSRASDAATQGAIGAGIGAAIPGVGSVLQSLMQNRALQRAIAAGAKNAPSTEEALARGNRLYDQIDAAGVQIKPQAFDDARAAILNDLNTKTGYDNLPGTGLTPNAARVMQTLDESSAQMATDPTAALPFKALDQARRRAGAAAGNVTNKTDQKAGMTIIEGLDNLVNNLDPSQVVAGDAEALKALLPKAREAWSTAKKSQLIDDAIAAGENYLSGTSSGIRNQFRTILNNKKLANSFTEAEKAAMRRVINGSIPERLLNLVGGGLGQLGQVGIGFGVGGIPGAMLGAGAAAASRKASEAVTKSKAETVRALMANGGLKSVPEAPTVLRDLIEEALRRGTAPLLPRQ